MAAVSVHQGSECMDVDESQHTTPTRQRSFSHQVQSSSGVQHLLLTPPSHHRLNFEFNLEDHIKKTRKAAAYLKQVLHSQQCGGHCSSIQCRRISRILLHLEGCLNEQCLEPGCVTTKKLLRHSMECQHANSASVGSTAGYLDTPRTSVDSTGSSSLSSSLSSTSVPLLQLNIGGFTRSPQQSSAHFCLLCTIAKADTLTPRMAGLLEHGRSPSRSSFSEENSSAYLEEESEEDLRFMPVISDEIIEFSKIPFCRPRTRSMHPLSPQRSKTYSDSLCLESGLTAPSSPGLQQPSKKQRSKSLNAASPSPLPLPPLQAESSTTGAPIAWIGSSFS